MNKPRLAASLLALALLGAGARAQIRSLTLAEITRLSDHAVHGRIVASRAFRVDDPREGELYFTTLTIQGEGLRDARPTTVDVTFRGGFVSPTEGVFNSEAPPADDVKVGRAVVAFYRWSDDAGGGTPANLLVAAHGGLYRVVEGARGSAVLGRGEGYAIRSNVRVEDLRAAVRELKGR